MICIIAVIFQGLLPYLPSPDDKHGWGLRVHSLSANGPLLVGETIDQYRFQVSLINFSDRQQFHDPLDVTYKSRALDIIILGPNGTDIGATIGEINIARGRRDPSTVQTKLPPGRMSSLDLRFGAFGYYLLAGPGRYRVETMLALNTDGKPDGRVVSAPPVTFEVLDLKAETIVSEQKVPLEGRELGLPKDEQDRPFIRQVKGGDRTLLIYRRYYGPKRIAALDPALHPVAEVAATYRLAELPGKCEMTVEGAYGAGNPLTITYKTSPTAKPTKLVINSIDGRPWTEEEERWRQERLREKNGLPPLAPPPRAVRR